MWRFNILYAFGISVVRWNLMSGDGLANQKTDHTIGSRSGGITYKDGDTYDTFYIFGGLQYDAKTGASVLQNDIWVHKSGVFQLVNTGSGDSSYPPSRQLGSACGVSSLLMVVFGGLTGADDTPLGDTWIYYFTDKKWVSLDTLHTNTTQYVSPPARADMAHWCVDGKLYIFGGTGQQGELMGDLWEFSILSMTWRQIIITHQVSSSLDKHIVNKLFMLPVPRSGAMTWVSGSHLYMFGGNSLNDTKKKQQLNIGLMSDLWRYDTSDSDWTRVAGSTSPGQVSRFTYRAHHHKSNSPGCRQSGATFTDTHGNLWLVGGQGADTDKTTGIKNIQSTT